MPDIRPEIRRVGVIGAGTMGAGIAAQVANAGHPVLLLDIVPKGSNDRDAVAKGAVEKLLKAEPAAFMTKSAARRVETGNVEDHLDRLAKCDWIIEAVVERLDVKHDLYRRLDAVRRPGTAISSNTSTIPLAKLTKGFPDAFRRDFLITHFFNPPRYMRLLELVTGPETDAGTAEAVARFADRVLGKSIVRCEDSPGFIANRLGIYWMQLAVVETLAAGLTIEEADAALGAPMGVPRTGVFGLMDLVGLDLGPHLNASMASTLPKGDAFHAVNKPFPLLDRMLAEGYTGRKGKGGFYRVRREGSERTKEAIDLGTGEYRPERKAKLEARDPRAAMEEGTLGALALRVMGQVIAYAATLIPSAAADVNAIDEAMRLGYNWKYGPFELADKLGVDWLLGKLDEAGMAVPGLLRDAAGKSFYRTEAGKRLFLGADGAYHEAKRAEGVLLLEDIKRTARPVAKNGSAALWDIGDGVACFEFTSRMNALDEAMLTLLDKSIDIVRERFRALVVYNEGENFSVGANLGVALFAANIAAWGEIEKAVTLGQKTYKKLKYAPFPVVVAPAGMALGGGCEIALHADAIVAHAETYMGLVETGVGLVPGWGGCGELVARWRADETLPKGPMPAVAKAFETISTATVSKSAQEARDLRFLREGDVIVFNRDRLLAEAKARALAMVDGYTPPEPPVFTWMPGPAGQAGMKLAVDGFHRRGIATDHDRVVGVALAEALSGGEADLTDTLTEQEMLDIERAAFVRLARTPGTIARVEHMLETGKPLRN